MKKFALLGLLFSLAAFAGQESGSPDQVLRVPHSGGRARYGALDLSQSPATTGQLPISRGGTGQATKTAAFDALSPNTTKGDLAVHNGTNNVRQAVGADGSFLTADSSQATGVKWQAPVTAIPSGSVMAFAGTTAPSGWLLCDGSTVSRTTYANLYAAVGNAFGNGNGTTTFHLPDLRGRFVRGTDDMGTGAAGIDPDSAGRTAQHTGGNTGNAVGTEEGHAVGSHTHQVTWNNGAGGGAAGTSVPGQPVGVNDMGRAGAILTGQTSTETRPINLNFHYIIKI